MPDRVVKCRIAVGILGIGVRTVREQPGDGPGIPVPSRPEKRAGYGAG